MWDGAGHKAWPSEARRSLFPDWPWLCDESSPHRRALHIPVQILAGKFKMEFLPTTSLTKAFPVAQICPNLHKIVSSSAGTPFLIFPPKFEQEYAEPFYVVMTHHTAKANLEKGSSWPSEAIPYGVSPTRVLP